MAANTSFKVQCPSCEANVPVRDPNLIGKKIDCPKCKYRFVVEDPDAEKSAAPKGKKKGNNTVLLVGAGLGGVALVVLGIVGYMLVFGDDKPKPKPTGGPVTTNTQPSTTPNQPATTPNTAANTTPPAGDTTPPPMQTPAVAPAVAPAAVVLDPGVQNPVSEVTNLLPNDTHRVIDINMDRMRNSTIGQLAFDPPLGFKPETFTTGFGLGVDEMVRLVRGENAELHWSFNIIKTRDAVTLEKFQAPLGLKKGPKGTIQGRNYFVMAPNPLLDHLSTILESEFQGARPAARRRDSEPLTLVQLDPTTLVVAQQSVMEEFLQNNAEPRKNAQVLVGAGETPAATPQPSIGPRRGGRGATPPPADGGDPNDPQFTERNSFLTVDLQLKSMLDQLEQDRDNVVICMAELTRTDEQLINRIKSLGLRTLNGSRVLGAVVQKMDTEKCQGVLALDFAREPDAKLFEEEIKVVLPPAATLIGLFLGNLHIDVEGGAATPAGPGPVGPGPGALRPPGVGRGPGPGPAGGDPNNPGGPDNGPKSHMKIERRGRVLVLHVDLNLTEQAHEQIYSLSRGLVMRMKGMVDMSSGDARYFELAQAGVKYRKEAAEKEKKAVDTYPRATFPREDTQGRLSRSWPPNQRVGWMAGLLPYLGYQEIYDRIDLNQSWKSEINIKQGAVLIPAFLNPRYSADKWRAHPPSLGVGRDMGATHFVGISGIGLEAADYDANDPNLTKKLGVFGYNRRTKAADITDGLANTILMIQVRPDQQRPWIEGGGATVTGIRETNSVKEFCLPQGNGKVGTYVIMCDGSVRFVKDDIADDVFKAMCTIKGGEEIADLNQVAPKVDPKGSSLRTTAKAGGE
jgi:hypothetical protein